MTVATLRRRRTILIALLAALAIWAFIFKAAERMPDFEVYWRAAVRASAGEGLYRVEDGHWLFKYLPAFAVLAIPIGLLPLTWAKALWFSTSVVMMVWVVVLGIRLLPERRKSTTVLAVLTVIVLGKFYAHEIVLGQVNLFFTIVVTTALLAIKTGREAWAGAFVALAIVVKPYAVLLVPWLMARRRPQAILGASAGLLLALLLPIVIYGIDGTITLHRAWWQTVADSTAPNLLGTDNVSLASLYARWFDPGPLAARLAALTGMVLLGLFVVVFVRRRPVVFPEGLEGGFLLTLMPLLSPQGWDYVFLVSTPAIVYLANYEDRLPSAMRLATIVACAVIGLTIYDVVGATAYRAFMRWSMISLCFLVVIAALATLRWRKIA